MKTTIVTMLFAFLVASLFLQSVFAVPQIIINSPLNQTYNTNDILIDIIQIENNPEMMWYSFLQEEWLTFMENPNNTGYTDNFNPPELVKLWNYTTGDRVVVPSAISDEVVYFGSYDDNLYAFYINGTQKWNFTTGGNVRSSPTILDEIYFSSFDDKFYSLNINGTEKWSFTTGGNAQSSSTISNGVIYFGSDDDNLYAFYINGTQKWNFTTGGNVRSTPAISNEVIYFGSSDYNLYALYLNGTKKWNYTTGDEIRDSSPTIYDGVVYIGGFDDNLYAIYTNGTKKWNFTTGSNIKTTTAIADGVIYLTGYDYNLYALYLNGTKKWNYTTGGAIVTSSPIVSNGVIYVGSQDDNFYAFYLNGTQKWNFTTGSNVDASPSMANGIVYIGSNDNNFYAFGDGSTTNSIERNIILLNGVYELKVFSRNTTGDYNTSTIHFTVNDITPPTIIIHSPQNTTYPTTTIPIEVSADETINTWWYNLDGSGNIIFVPNTTITVNESSHNLIIYANDSSGNIGSSEIDFTIVIPPILNITATWDTGKKLPILNKTCNGNNLVVIRQRESCISSACETIKQTDITQCPFGCEENLSKFGADCIPTTFETFYTGWGLFLIGLVILLFIAYSLKKKKKRKNQRWL